MIVDERLKALRSDPASQRRAKARMLRARKDWLARPGNARLADEFTRFAEGEALDDLPELARLTRDHAAAKQFVSQWQLALIDVLFDEPLALVPWRHQCASGMQAIQIMTAKKAALTIMTYEDRADPDDALTGDQGSHSGAGKCNDSGEPKFASFADSELREIVLKGSASGAIHRLNPARAGEFSVSTEQANWREGDRIATSGADQTRQIFGSHGGFALLQLSRGAANPAVRREISLEENKVIHQSSGDKGVSQDEMAIAVLGAMRRSDAAPVIAEVAKSGPAHLRWEGVRHATSLDPKTGIGLLDSISANASDELHQPAIALREQIKSDYPQFFDEEAAPCPA